MINTIEDIAKQAEEYVHYYVKTHANKFSAQDKANVDRGEFSYLQEADESRREIINITRRFYIIPFSGGPYIPFVNEFSGSGKNRPEYFKFRLGGEPQATGVYEDCERRSQQRLNSKDEGDRLFFSRIQYVKKHNVGNCCECADLAIEYMQTNHPSIEAEKFRIVNWDHNFVVINRKEGSDQNDPSTWGDDCWFCDPWGRGCGKASDLVPFLKKLCLDYDGTVLDLNKEHRLESDFSGIDALTSERFGLSEDLASLIDQLNKMSNSIEKVIKEYENSSDERLQKLCVWLRNKKQKIDNLCLKAGAQKKEFIDNFEKYYHYLELEKILYKVRDMVREAQKSTEAIFKSRENIEKVLPDSSNAIKQLYVVMAGFDTSFYGNYDFPDAPKASSLVRTFSDGNKERIPIQPFGEQYSPRELAQKIASENDWSNITKAKFTDTNGQLIVKKKKESPTPSDKPKISFTFWVKTQGMDLANQKLETESSMKDIILTF